MRHLCSHAFSQLRHHSKKCSLTCFQEVHVQCSHTRIRHPVNRKSGDGTMSAKRPIPSKIMQQPQHEPDIKKKINTAM